MPTIPGVRRYKRSSRQASLTQPGRLLHLAIGGWLISHNRLTNEQPPPTHAARFLERRAHSARKDPPPDSQDQTAEDRVYPPAELHRLTGVSNNATAKPRARRLSARPWRQTVGTVAGVGSVLTARHCARSRRPQAAELQRNRRPARYLVDPELEEDVRAKAIEPDPRLIGSAARRWFVPAGRGACHEAPSAPPGLTNPARCKQIRADHSNAARNSEARLEPALRPPVMPIGALLGVGDNQDNHAQGTGHKQRASNVCGNPLTILGRHFRVETWWIRGRGPCRQRRA